MFSIIISEKGGAERREHYDRTEINVGRVQGNDLMLPKGNVSKRHARLLYRDGRFIVTDLKSTNGTYVNGRKIAQATIVREGDKIYIGDFVLRIESEAGLAGQQAPSDDSSGGEQAEPSNPQSSPSPSSAEKAMRPPAPRIEAKAEEQSAGKSGDVISHFPLEHDPDDSAPAAYVPAPPRVPSGTTRAPNPATKPSGSQQNNPAIATVTGMNAPPISPISPIAPIAPISPIAPIAPVSPVALVPPITPGPTPPPAMVVPSGIPVTPGRRAIPPMSDRDRQPSEAPSVAAHRHALAALIDRIGSQIDLTPITGGAAADEHLVGRIERALAENATTMRAAGELPAEVDPDSLVVEARRELLELGPIGPLLADEDVSEVQVVRHDFVVAMHGKRQVATEVAFTSEAAVARLVRRLCVDSGRPLDDRERFVERRLPQSSRLFAVMPPAPDHGHMVVIRKPQRADFSLDDLVRSGTISRAMAGLLAQCVTARANILVTGALGAGTTSLLGALAGAGSTDDRVIVLQEDDEIIFNQPHTVSILLGGDGNDGPRAVRAAARVHPDRLVVGSFAGHVAAEVVDAIGDGVDGVLAAARAPTLRHAAIRLTADLAATRPGITPEAAREWLASAFDVAIEIARLRDGRHRVLRISELGVEPGAVTIRDVFSFAIERTAAGGAVEGTFHASGVVPRFIDDLNARGNQFDTSIFKRAQPR
jgi:pilus assembly protein CpaF